MIRGLLLVATGLYITLGERITLGGATGHGIYSPLAICVVVLAAAYAVSSPAMPPPRVRLFGVTVGPLLLGLTIFPVLGIFFTHYPVTAVYAATAGAVPLALILLGFSRASGLSVGVRLMCAATILAHGLYGLGQALDRLHLLPAGSWGWADRWDYSVQAKYGTSFLVSSRSTGLFVNANEFGLWSVLAIAFSVSHLKGPLRYACALMGILGIVCSQSRTAVIAAAVIGIYAIVLALRGRLPKPGLADVAALVALIASLAVFWSKLSKLVESQFIARLTSGSRVIDSGAASDANLSDRLQAWRGAGRFLGDYPLGSLGPPQVRFGSLIDNQFVYLLLQGSVLLVAAYVLAFRTPSALRRAGARGTEVLVALLLVIFIFSTTAAPLGSIAASSLAWLVGAGLFARIPRANEAPTSRPLARVGS